jgi:DegV family protein with EDD domain
MSSANPEVRVVTDSAAAIDPDVAAAHGVRIVQMAVQMGGQPLTEAEAADLIRARPEAAVRTSGPSPGQFLAAISGPPAPLGVVIITVAAALSGTHNAAMLAARLTAGSGGPAVEVVDSGSAAGGQALVALAAARAAARGLSVAGVAQTASGAAAGVRLLGIIGSVDALVRGGRLPAAAGAAGCLAGVQPLFELRHGRVHPLWPAFTRSAALDRLVGAVRREQRNGAVAEVAVSHGAAATDASELIERLTRDINPDVVTVGGLGAAMLAHAGAGTLGLAWRWRPSP